MPFFFLEQVGAKIGKWLRGRRMTKEELEKEAEEYADKHAFRVPYDGSNNFYDDVDFKASKEGYLAGAEPREKRIAELEDKLANADYQLEGRDNEIAKLTQQIEKMKCCGNCEWRVKDVCNGNNTCGLKEWKFDEGRR